MAQGRLAGKTAFLTAAGQGIGHSTALAFQREGARVFATDVSAELMENLSAEVPDITTNVLDARDTNAIRKAAQNVGPVDILFNCAGFVHHGNILETEEKDWDFSYDLNVKSLWRTLRAFLPSMIENGGGSIVNMSSAAQTIKAAPNRACYSSTKAAVAALTKSVAVDFVKDGISLQLYLPWNRSITIAGRSHSGDAGNL